MNIVKDVKSIFQYEHLPPHLQEVSKPFYEIAVKLVDKLPPSSVLDYTLNNLLTAKDNAVRLAVDQVKHNKDWRFSE